MANVRWVSDEKRWPYDAPKAHVAIVARNDGKPLAQAQNSRIREDHEPTERVGLDGH